MYLAIDGDDVGRAVERLIVLASAQEVSAFSRQVSDAMETIVLRIQALGAIVVMQGGDSILAELAELPLEDLEQLIRVEPPAVTFSAGIGQTMSEAFLALKLAKAAGKHRCVKWAATAGFPPDLL